MTERARRRADRPVNESDLAMKGRRKRILVADDDIDFRWVLSEAMKPLAEKVTTATNGCEAVEKMRSECHDVVLMDMHMPCKSGLDALREMRRADKKMKIYILTLAPTTEMIREVYLERANGFFVKPVFFEDMESLTEDLISRIWGVTPSIDKGFAYCAPRESSMHGLR